MAILDEYKQIILTSSLLTQEQREAYLDGCENMPEEYLRKIITILEAYDKRAQVRKEEFDQKIEQIISRFKKQIDESAERVEIKQKLLKDIKILQEQLKIQTVPPVTLVGQSI